VINVKNAYQGVDVNTVAVMNLEPVSVNLSGKDISATDHLAGLWKIMSDLEFIHFTLSIYKVSPA